MTALALREDQDYWDDRQLAVLLQTGIGEDVSKAELASFLHECQQRKLDPFTRQIYLIGRYDKRAGRAVYRSQTGIDGFRLIARRSADKAGETIEYEETIWYEPDGKTGYEVWPHSEPPFACKVTVLRNGKRFPVQVRYDSYVQADRDGRPLGLWAKMPDSQLEKCCEAKALRKAFPEELGGIYTEDEMAQADNPQRVAATVEVIREEPAPVDTDEEWLTDAVARAASFTAPDEGRRLWRETAAKASARQVTAEDARRIQEVIKARMEDLGREQQQAQDPAERAFAEADKALARLDPDDAWTDRVREISDEDEARQVLADLAGSGVDIAKGHLIRDAILTRWPDAADVTAKAA